MKSTYPGWILWVREKILKVFIRYSIPKWMVFITDSIVVFLAFLLAYILRYNFEISTINYTIAISQGMVVSAVYIILSLIFRSYSGILRHTTLTDISLVFTVTTLSLAIVIGIALISRSLEWGNVLTLPYSVVLIHYVSVIVILFFERVFVKVVFLFATKASKRSKNILIYGAGNLGFIIKQVVLSDPRIGFDVKGFIEKDKNLRRKKINGIPVYDIKALSKEFLTKNKIRSLILADKDLSIEEKSTIIRKCINLGLEVLETPEVDKWLTGQVNTNQFQRVKLEDLLGRAPIKLDLDIIRDGLNNKTILVTGAAGSIGSEIVRQLVRFCTKKVILVDQAETPLFFLGKELEEKFPGLNFKAILGDVTNEKKMSRIFREFQPKIVFHAAAYKHVSLMEENPHEAIRVNVGGTRLMTHLAVRNNVEKFVMISTDKSVNPSSVMGVSKRICEKIVQSASQIAGYNTQFIITRFGNVLGSNGSVIPIFCKQIQAGGPVTVTDPRVYRYFMTITEACQLVLEAGFMGKGGEIFVFDMGEQVKILDLATNMIKLYGLIPGKDIQIAFTGLRPGEKLYEELLTNHETTLPTHNPKIKKARVENIDGPVVMNRLEIILDNLYDLSKSDILRIFKELVPEYSNGNGEGMVLEEQKPQRKAI